MSVARLPSSWTISTVWWCKVPAVSLATGLKMWVVDCWLHLLVLLVAARLAAAAVSMAVLLTWASAYVSGTVTFHASGLGLSTTAGSWCHRCVCRLAEACHWFLDCWIIERQMTSWRCGWRCYLRALFRQASPWSQRASTTFPQPQVCGSNPVCGRLISEFFIWLS